jgi:hypothetical protein
MPTTAGRTAIVNIVDCCRLPYSKASAEAAVKLDEDIVVATAMVFLVAGYDTTGISILDFLLISLWLFLQNIILKIVLPFCRMLPRRVKKYYKTWRKLNHILFFLLLLWKCTDDQPHTPEHNFFDLILHKCNRRYCFYKRHNTLLPVNCFHNINMKKSAKGVAEYLFFDKNFNILMAK